MPDAVARRPVGPAESARASRAWWDAEAASYVVEHGSVLGTAALMWGPEGVYETDLNLLGELAGRTVLEFGCGAAQGSRWCADRGARVVACDISGGMLEQARRLDREHGAGPAAYLQCDAAALPLADGCVDVAFSAYGALPFAADSGRVLAEVARVLRPGGRLVFSLTHPVRWALPDVPGEEGLVVRHSYFDRRPYVETDGDGVPVYVEHHRTLGDRVREITACGLRLVDLVEPEWPPGTDHEWGGWSRRRGELLPGTAIFVCERP